jgi:thioredoxin-dependent peroxiredoxin
MLSWLFSDPLPVGTPAPPFILPDEEGGVVVLYGLKGRPVVLVFYPKDDTPVCTSQLCELRDEWEKLQSAKAHVYAINPGDAASHQAFRKKHQFPFPLLVDYGQRVAKMYHAGGPVVKRTVYVIGPDAVIRYAQRGKPSVDEILTVIASLNEPAKAAQ